MARQSLALDNFNRSSGLTNWNVIYQDGGTPTFENSEAIYLASNYGKFEMVWNANAPTASQSVRVRWKTLGNSNTALWGGVRGSLTTGDCYLVECPANGQPTLYRWQGGTGTQLAQFTSTAWAIGDDLFVDVENNGSNQPVISVYRNTTLLGTYTDTGGSPFQSGYGVCGSWCDGGSVRLDEFEVYNVVASSAFDGTAAIAVLAVQSAAGTGVFGTLHYVSGTLVDSVSGNPLPNLSGLHAAWFDTADPALMIAPTDVTTTLSTNVNGVFKFDLPNSLLTSGQTGTLVLADAPLVKTASYKMTVQ